MANNSKEKVFPNTELGNWLQDNEAYFYYLSYLEKRLEKCSCNYFGSVAEIQYSDYFLLRLEVVDHSIYLTFPKENSRYYHTAVQKKLFHEYREAFRLGEADYKLTQQNLIILDKYFDKATAKIDAGFKKYNLLIQERNLREDNTAFLKIGIHNSFSIEEFVRLIKAYNELYSILYCVYEEGYEKTNEKPLNEMLTKHSMVLESVNIGSEGFLIGVLKDVISAAIIALGKAILEDNRNAYALKKQELLDKAKNETPDVGKRVLELTTRMDNFLRLKESGRVPTYAIDIEVNRIMEEIATLQGTPRLDVYM